MSIDAEEKKKKKFYRIDTRTTKTRNVRFKGTLDDSESHVFFT